MNNKLKVLEVSNRTQFITANVEKSIRLMYILVDLNQLEQFKGCFALKGGTAINLCIVDCIRLSIDIDLDYSRNVDKETAFKDRLKLREELVSYAEEKGYEISKKSRSTYALDSYTLSYIDIKGNKDNIKLDINYLDREHILPLEYRKMSDKLVCKDIEILTLNPLETYGSKVNALISRHTPRDLYDVYAMLKFDKIDNLDLFRKCFIFYNIFGGKQNADNIDYSVLDNYSYDGVKRFLKPVISKVDKFDYQEAVNYIKEKLPSMLVLTQKEKEFISKYREGKFLPELLFEDEEILTRIKNHPLIHWKKL